MSQKEKKEEGEKTLGGLWGKKEETVTHQLGSPKKCKKGERRKPQEIGPVASFRLS